MPKSKLYRSSDFLKTLQNKPFCGFKCGQKKSGRLLKAHPITLSFRREPETVSSLNQYYLAAGVVAAAAGAAAATFLAFLAFFFFLALATGVVAAAGAAAAGAAAVVSCAIETPVPTNNTVNKATIKRFIQPP